MNFTEQTKLAISTVAPLKGIELSMNSLVGSYRILRCGGTSGIKLWMDPGDTIPETTNSSTMMARLALPWQQEM